MFNYMFNKYILCTLKQIPGMYLSSLIDVYPSTEVPRCKVVSSGRPTELDQGGLDTLTHYRNLGRGVGFRPAVYCTIIVLI